MLEFDAERCRGNVAGAQTEDLLDRVTAFRNDLEPDAVPIILAELLQRGFGPAEIAAHADRHGEILVEDGHVLKCSACYRPAIVAEWTWHRLWAVIPLFPRLVRWCSVHRPAGRGN